MHFLKIHGGILEKNIANMSVSFGIDGVNMF